MPRRIKIHTHYGKPYNPNFVCLQIVIPMLSDELLAAAVEDVVLKNDSCIMGGIRILGVGSRHVF